MTKERLLECVKELVSHQYVIRVGPHFVFTKKFNKDFSGIDLGVEPLASQQVRVSETVPIKRKGATVILSGGVEADSNDIDWVKLYQTFIMTDVNVPPYGYNTTGNQYQINAATKVGREAFKKILVQEKVGYDDLVRVAKQYYSRGPMYLTKIETFLSNEMWRMGINDPTYKPKSDAGPKFG